MDVHGHYSVRSLDYVYSVALYACSCASFCVAMITHRRLIRVKYQLNFEAGFFYSATLAAT